MSDAVIQAALQAGPVVGIVFAVLGLLLKREISSNTVHREARAEWKIERSELKQETIRLEKELDQEISRRRKAEDDLAAYRREHP